MTDRPPGVHLVRTDENLPEIDALAAAYGGRVPLATLLDDLDRHGRRGFAPGLAVRRATTWDRADRHDPRWWPQGITTSADASPADGLVEGRQVAIVSWYAKELPAEGKEQGEDGSHGVRVSVLDLRSRRYTHVLLVEPALADGVASYQPLLAHAGGLVWDGVNLHVAATARGFHTCCLEDLLQLPEPVDGCRYALPVRYSYRARTDKGLERLRYSFLSLDHAASPPTLVVGEYGGEEQTRRLARYALDPETRFLTADADGLARPVVLEDGGVVRTQGAAVAHGCWYLTSSNGPRKPGSVFVGVPGAFRRFRWAAPPGPEDVAWWPSTDLLWSVTEHPGKRWVFAMRRSYFE